MGSVSAVHLSHTHFTFLSFNMLIIFNVSGKGTILSLDIPVCSAPELMTIVGLHRQSTSVFNSLPFFWFNMLIIPNVISGVRISVTLYSCMLFPQDLMWASVYTDIDGSQTVYFSSSLRLTSLIVPHVTGGGYGVAPS